MSEHEGGPTRVWVQAGIEDAVRQRWKRVGWSGERAQEDGYMNAFTGERVACRWSSDRACSLASEHGSRLSVARGNDGLTRTCESADGGDIVDACSTLFLLCDAPLTPTSSPFPSRPLLSLRSNSSSELSKFAVTTLPTLTLSVSTLPTSMLASPPS